MCHLALSACCLLCPHCRRSHLGWRGRYVQESDLEYFKDRVERDVDFPGCGDWDLVMAKDIGGGVRYTAWKRHLAVRPCCPAAMTSACGTKRMLLDQG